MHQVLSLESVLDRFGSVWNRFRIDLESVWDQLGSGLRPIWNWLGVKLGPVWDLFGEGLCVSLGSKTHEQIRLGTEFQLLYEWMDALRRSVRQ